MLRGVLAIRGQAAARGGATGSSRSRGARTTSSYLGSEVTDEHGGPATRGEWSVLDGRAVEIGDVRLLPVENASTDGAEASTADAGVPENAANEEPWVAGIRAHLERRGWTQGELASWSSLKLNTVGAVLRGDPTSTRTLTAIAAGFGVGTGGGWSYNYRDGSVTFPGSSPVAGAVDVQTELVDQRHRSHARSYESWHFKARGDVPQPRPWAVTGNWRTEPGVPRYPCRRVQVSPGQMPHV